MFPKSLLPSLTFIITAFKQFDTNNSAQQSAPCCYAVTRRLSKIELKNNKDFYSIKFYENLSMNYLEILNFFFLGYLDSNCK